MKRRKQMRWWAAVLLCAVFLRALIPVGFMPVFGGELGVRMVICDAYAPMPDMDMKSPMDMSGAGKGAPPHQDHGSCPFGSSPALGALPMLAILPATLQRPAPLVMSAPQIGHFEVSPRAQSPRGPPA